MGPNYRGAMLDPLETERLVIRRPVIGDVETLHRRRDHPDTARWQDWTVPYPLERARRLVAGATAMDGPTDGEWWMAMIDERETGDTVGDLAVRLDDDGRSATIGYTLHPDHWGRGYATEAAGALVDRLIADGVRRLSATTHPDNLASVRVLERIGFRHEGRTVGSFFEGDGPDAPTSDDLLLGMTAAGRAAWSTRPTGPPAGVRLVPVDRDNQQAVEKLETHHSQRKLVATVLESFADALFSPVEPWLRAIEATETGPGDGTGPGEDTVWRPVGFLMVRPPTDAGPEPYLWRMLVDRAHQGRGVGGRALDELEAGLARDGHRSIRVHWVPGPGSPEGFYRGRGYEPTGQVEDGEVEGRKMLAS